MISQSSLDIPQLPLLRNRVIKLSPLKLYIGPLYYNWSNNAQWFYFFINSGWEDYDVYKLSSIGSIFDEVLVYYLSPLIFRFKLTSACFFLGFAKVRYQAFTGNASWVSVHFSIQSSGDYVPTSIYVPDSISFWLYHGSRYLFTYSKG